ncbi:hypothetical protein MKD49_22940 [Herbaspirillum sp. WGmk3]|uniref:hypothetical protein n=1 Tax=Herbaspirillum sp. WGmk3 TaxID=2919925 RepID=UPI00209137B5|nr:hypothetical protein [Herbaspirillum sp. WGmk3]MCO4859364.1 hypothetical protein [Herbaspirillum sp. WGmk3]
MFGITGRIWSALATVIKLEDKVILQSEALRQQQIRIENLTERMIKLETLLEVVLHASEFKRIK